MRPAAVMCVVAVALLVLARPAAGGSAVSLDGRVGQQPLSRSTGDHATRLDPKQLTTVVVRITNRGSAPIEARTVRLDGRVLGLTFFAYDTAVRLAVAPGATETLSFPLDLTGLDGQATGLLPGSLQVLDAHRHVLASQHYVADVSGSLWSVYGLFGLALLVLTALSFGSLALALSRNRLPPNRWRRGLRFLTTGIGVGLVVTFFLSAVRLFVPAPGRWLLFAALFALVFFAVGYLTPEPDADDADDPAPETDEVAAGTPGPAR